MIAELRYVLAMSCLLPVLVGCCLYRKMQPQYHLLIYMLLMDAVTETIDFTGIKYPAFAPVASCWVNAYMMISLFLFLTLIQQHGYVKKRLLQALVVAAAGIAVYNFFELGSPFSNFYASLLVYMFGAKLFMAIAILSKQITVVNVRLVRNFWFWAGCLFVVQNAYGFLVFGLVFGLSAFDLFKLPDMNTIGMLNLYVNVFYYSLLAVVLVLVPKRNNRYSHQIS